MSTSTHTMADVTATSSRGHAAWAIDKVQSVYTGTSDADALEYVQAGYEEFLYPTDPRTGFLYEWSFLTRAREMTLTASVEGTASGSYSSDTIDVTATTEIFSSGHVGMYLYVKDVGTYRISTYTSTTEVTVAVTSGSTAADFTSKSVWLVGIYDLPSDFGGMIGEPIYPYSDDYDTPDFQEVGQDYIERLWRADDDEDDPRYYAVVGKEFNSSDGQRYQLWVAPRPEDTRVIRYDYHVNEAVLTDSSSRYFLGGQQHWETIRLAALAKAEIYQGQTDGVMEQRYQKALMRSIDIDKQLFETEGPLSMAFES